MSWIRPRLTYANVMSTIAVFGILAGGGAYAASKIGANDIKKNAVRAKHIKKNQVKGKHIRVERFHRVGASGEPEFETGWGNLDPNLNATAGFHKDPLGVVHLKGHVTGGAGPTIFTLPPRYRPGKASCASSWHDNYVCAFTDGSVQLGFGSDEALLDGLSFRAGAG